MSEERTVAPGVRGLYTPKFVPGEENITHQVPSALLQSFEEAQQAALARISEAQRLREASISPFGDPEDQGAGRGRRPLTFEEAEAVEAEKNALIERIRETRQKIKNIQDQIESMVRSADASAGEYSFTIDVGKRPFLKRAIKKAFGRDDGVITYSMYLAALQVRKELEEKEADAYTSGDWQSDEDDE